MDSEHSIELPASLWAQLGHVARRRGRSASMLAVHVLQDWVDGELISAPLATSDARVLCGACLALGYVEYRPAHGPGRCLRGHPVDAPTEHPTDPTPPGR